MPKPTENIHQGYGESFLFGCTFVWYTLAGNCSRGDDYQKIDVSLFRGTLADSICVKEIAIYVFVVSSTRLNMSLLLLEDQQQNLSIILTEQNHSTL